MIIISDGSDVLSSCLRAPLTSTPQEHTISARPRNSPHPCGWTGFGEWGRLGFAILYESASGLLPLLGVENLQLVHHPHVHDLRSHLSLTNWSWPRRIVRLI